MYIIQNNNITAYGINDVTNIICTKVKLITEIND